MSFIKYLREAEKKKKTKKEKDATVVVVNKQGEVPGSATGNVMDIQNGKLPLTPAEAGNVEAYNVMRAFAMGMENNISSIVLLKSHPTPEIAQQAEILEKDVRAVIQFVLNMQIPL